jgi:CBS domain-containing protein
MFVRDLMRAEVPTAGPADRFADLLRRQCDLATRQLYVVDRDRRLLGIITGYDLLKLMIPDYLSPGLAHAAHPVDDHLLAQRFRDNLGKTAEAIMTREYTALSPGDTLIEANAIIRERRFNALPVVENEKLVGEVGRKDVLRHIAVQVCGLALD